MNISKDLVAASAPSIILSILNTGDSYGYELIKSVEQLSQGRWIWSEGMLYPILHRFEKNGWIRSYWNAPQGGRRRKYYHLEDPGRLALEEHQRQWMEVHGLMRRIWPEGGDIGSAE